MKLLSSMLLLMTASALGAVLEVDRSIAESLAAAQPGDTLLLRGPAVYRERWVVEKPVHLKAINEVVLDGQGSGTPLTIRAADVKIEGLRIRNSGRDLAEFDSAVMIQGARASIVDCQIENDGFGIYIRGVSECQILGNRIIGSTNLASAARGNGLHLWKTRKNRIANNAILQKRDGIYLSYADQNNIVSNEVRQTRFGIHYMYSHQNHLVANRCEGNTVGATLMFARQCRIENNSFVTNRRHGLLLKQVESSQILGNLTSGHNRGFFVQQCAQNQFRDNRLIRNDIGLYLSSGSEENLFAGNAFVSNTDQIWQPPDEMERGRKSANRFYEKGRGNFWSDYTGSDRQGDGIGDTPYHETDIFGYLLDRYPEARLFAMSPAVALLRRGEELLPILHTAGVTDLYPLMKEEVGVVGRSMTAVAVSTVGMRSTASGEGIKRTNFARTRWNASLPSVGKTIPTP